MIGKPGVAARVVSGPDVRRRTSLLGPNTLGQASPEWCLAATANVTVGEIRGAPGHAQQERKMAQHGAASIACRSGTTTSYLTEPCLMVLDSSTNGAHHRAT